ncbi:hypothetical protein DFS34DRAFT_624591 [Phlyctochytrium arcticum]|nr:hypothetical protein DFS34DRAFT_624591 [Phlyctochytrium arcticum]
MLKHFGGCAVPRINTGMSGTRCENFGAPKPLVLFLFLTPANFRTWSNTRYHEMDGGKRNSIKFESIFFNDDQIKDVLGHEMGGISELMTHGTFHEYVGTLDLWSKGGGFSQFPIYDFFHQSRDFSSRDRWYSKRGSNLWFLFFHGLWLETGQNIHFLTKFWNNYSLHYPKSYNSTTQVWTQAGNINIGEVIHFMSAAVGRNLTATASSRFTTNWKPETYFAAVAEYPALTYVS